MPKKILYAPSGDADRDIAPGLVPAGYALIECALGTAEMNAHLADAEFLVGFGALEMNDAFFKMAPKLKLIQLLSAGYDKCDVEAARRAGVPIANNGGANAVAVAEHALMLMLAISRRLVWQHKSVSSGVWRGNDWQDKHVYELQGKMLGIIGLGTIGKKVARLAQAFGMRVQYYDTIRLNEDGEDAIGARFRLMDEVLATSDLVSLHVPLLADTKHMIGARELGLMKQSAFLINTCRGPVVDEAALIKALQDNVIAGAGLDVLDQEPPPPDNPLFTLENCILTAHLAGPTYENRAKRFRNAFDNVERVARGQTAYWIIPELRG